MRKILYAVFALGCLASLFTSCEKNDDTPTVLGNAVVQLNVGTKAGETESPTTEELKLKSLRVYAFVGEQPAGHYFTDKADLTFPASFLMDMKLFSTTTQDVDFYVIANEAAMGGLNVEGKSFTFGDNTSESDLKKVRFTSLNTGFGSTTTVNGLPMFYQEKVTVDVAADDDDGVPDSGASTEGHEDHTLLDQKLEIGLQRPMAKLGVYAAKVTGEKGTLKVTGARLRAQGVLQYNYVMRQESSVLQGIGSLTEAMKLPVIAGGVEVDKEIAKDAATAVRQEPTNYTDVLSAAWYPFENPNGSSDWSAPGPEAEKGNVLEVDYNFGGESKTGIVYLPAMERNHYYKVLCLMNNGGVISVAYTVADWDDATNWEGGLEFDYPTYVNPVQPLDGTSFVKPTMYYDGEDSEEGAFCVNFTITAPKGVEWTPTLPGTHEGYYKVKVYKGDVDQGAPPYNETTAGNPYTIKIIPTRQTEVGKSIKFGIAYKPGWLGETGQTSYLLINGEDGNTKWPDSGGQADYIEIQQVEQGQGN